MAADDRPAAPARTAPRDRLRGRADSLVASILRAASLEELRATFVTLRDDLRGLCAGFATERRERQAAVDRLEAERRRLLESVA